MADNRGGYRRPSKPAQRSGPGKHSKRTDGGRGTQPVRTPGLDHPEVQSGDVQRMQQAQADQPLPVRRAPSGGSPAPVPPMGSAGGPLPIPKDVLATPSNYPSEPVTAGLPMGPGMGPEGLPIQTDPEDIREVLLGFFASPDSGYDNEDARQMLEEIRQSKARPLGRIGATPSPVMTPSPVSSSPEEGAYDDYLYGVEAGPEESGGALPAPSEPVRGMAEPSQEPDEMTLPEGTPEVNA